MQLILTYTIAFAAAVALVPLCRLIAVRLGYVARPKADRWHSRQTALLGGVAIVTITVTGGWLNSETRHLWVILLSGSAIFTLGLVDDLVTLKPSTKLVGEIALASFFVYLGYRLHWSDSLTLDAMLTLFWVVGMTNAFNLLDNMDGLCAGIGLIVAGALMIAFIEADPARAQYLALMMGALSGFLIYNFNPASIFMGDSGSLFIGLTLSTLSLESAAAGGRAGSDVLSIIGAPLLLLLIPIFDTTLVTVLRLLSGRKPSQGGRDHSSHRLVAIGLPERKAVLVLWTLAALGGLIGLELRFSETGLGGPAAVAFVLAMMIFAVYLSHVRVYEASDSVLRTGKMTLFVSELMYKRRAAEVMLDVCLVALSYYIAYRLRFEGAEFAVYFPQFLSSMPIVIAVQMVTLFAFGTYRGVWRYFGLMDGVGFAKAVGLGTAAIVSAVVFVYRFENYSRGVFIIYGAILLLLLSGSRASFRLMSEFIRRRGAGDRLVIYGAGDGGSVAIRELMGDEHHYRILGFIDDDPAKQRLRVQGYPVLGGSDTLEVLVNERAVDAVVVSAREMAPAKLQRLEELCAANGIVLSRLHFRFERLVAS